MNGVHDIGGMHGFGAVDRSPEPPFEFDWVPAVIAMQSATVPAVANIDEFRHAIERMEPVHYLRSTYFEHWTDGIIRYCLEKGVFSEDDLAAREAYFVGGAQGDLPAITDSSPWNAKRHEGHPHRREPRSLPRFRPGAIVRTRRDQPAGHTRLPRYARGRVGTVVVSNGGFIFPDTAAHGLGDQPCDLYSVRFEARELWGDTAEPGVSVLIDLFETYLEPVEG